MAVPKAVSVGTSAISLIAQNDRRTLLVLQNLSNKVVFYGQDNTVTILNGLEIKAGAVLTEERTKDNNDFFYLGAYFAITETGTADIRIWEKEKVG